MYSICAIIVTFDPDIDSLENNLKSTSSQVDQLLIVDNNSNQDCHHQIVDLSNKYSTRIVSLQKNFGLATGQNIGIKWALKKGYTHVLLLDQDSIPYHDMVHNLRVAYKRLSEQNISVSAVGPTYYTNENIKGSSYFVRFGCLGIKKISCTRNNIRNYIKCDFLISSGAMISLKIINDVGMMDENLFIDHIDTEWFLRAKAKGYEAYGVCNALMLHSLGDKGIKLWFGRWLSIAQHKPERLYYDIRNSIIICKKNFISQKIVRVIFLRELRLILFYILFFPSRLTNIRYMVKGIKDGVQGKTGKIDKS